MPIQEPRHYRTSALLRDGGSVCVRAVQPDDKARVLALFDQLSSRSVYYRFFQTRIQD